jgi:predicted transcriptional regulator
MDEHDVSPTRRFKLKLTSRRSKLEIYIEILSQIQGGTVIPTRIMFGANLSWKPLQKNLKALFEKELIIECAVEADDKRTKKAYKLAEKGVNVLNYFNKAKEILEMDSIPNAESGY